jgi:hypothetical protein
VLSSPQNRQAPNRYKQKSKKKKCMNTHADKTQKDKSQAVSAETSRLQRSGKSTFQFVDNRPEAVTQRKLQEMANNSPQVSQLRAFQEMANNSPQTKQAAQLHSVADNHSTQQQQHIQKKGNNTGLPDNLKTGMENLSGMSMDDVKVHHNSDKPAQLQAHAHAQGTDIRLGHGQEKHLPHELGNAVQQKQGRVKATMQMKGKVNINDDIGLEKEADIMGAKAENMTISTQPTQLRTEYSTKSTSTAENKSQSSAQTHANAAENNGIGAMQLQSIYPPIVQRQKNIVTQLAVEGNDKISVQSANYTSLEGLAAKLNTVPEEIKALDHDKLVGIIKEVFQSNWFKMKSCLTTDNWPIKGEHPAHESSMQLMQAMVDMRGHVWDAFVKIKQPGITAKVEDFKNRHPNVAKAVKNDFTPSAKEIADGITELDKNFKLGDSAGSESVTSDLDLSAKGENTEIGLAMLNEEFVNTYGVEPGAMFDINVYASDWMFNMDFGKDTRKGDSLTRSVSSTSESVASTGKELSALKQREKEDKQEVWSMVKIRRNMNYDDWDTYKLHVLDGITDKAEMLQKFGQVEKEWREWHSTVERETKKLIDQLTEQEKMAEENSPFAVDGKDQFAQEGREMAASNRIYEKIMENVKVMRLKVQMLKNDQSKESQEKVEQLLVDISDNVSRGLTYANEVYATEGAVRHTVIGIQIGGKKLKGLKEAQDKDNSIKSVAIEMDITKPLFLQSVNENVGDTLHALHHNENDPQYAVFRAGKYIDRLCQAVVGLVGEENALAISSYNDLRKIGNKAVEEKAGESGKDPTAVHEPSSFFHNYDKGYLSVVKAMAMGLGAKSVAHYKKTQ